MPEIRIRYRNWIVATLLLGSLLPVVALSAATRVEQRELDRAESALRESLAQSSQLPVALSRDEDHLSLRIAASALFEPDSTVLTSDALKQPLLEAVLRLLKHRRTLAAQVAVFTDSIGGVTANQSFSAARAKALGAALIAAGVPAARLYQRGAGVSGALADNETPEGRLENRRLEIVIAPVRLAPIRLAPATGP